MVPKVALGPADALQGRVFVSRMPSCQRARQRTHGPHGPVLSRRGLLILELALGGEAGKMEGHGLIEGTSKDCFAKRSVERA